ncbi:unnamed protein product [Fusarium graminearum]|nr:unnamed protein product [Fusarium graminearum]
MTIIHNKPKNIYQTLTNLLIRIDTSKYNRTYTMCTTKIIVTQCRDCKRILNRKHAPTAHCKAFNETGKCPGALYPCRNRCTCQVEEYLYNTSSQKLIQQNRQIYIYIRTDKMCTTVISIITCSNCRRQLSSMGGYWLFILYLEKEEEKKKKKKKKNKN